MGVSGIRLLSPSKWEASTLPRGNAWNARQPDTIIILHFLEKIKFILTDKPNARLHPQPKGWGLVEGIANRDPP